MTQWALCFRRDPRGSLGQQPRPRQPQRARYRTPTMHQSSGMSLTYLMAFLRERTRTAWRLARRRSSCLNFRLVGVAGVFAGQHATIQVRSVVVIMCCSMPSHEQAYKSTPRCFWWSSCQPAKQHRSCLSVWKQLADRASGAETWAWKVRSSGLLSRTSMLTRRKHGGMQERRAVTSMRPAL